MLLPENINPRVLISFLHVDFYTRWIREEGRARSDGGGHVEGEESGEERKAKGRKGYRMDIKMKRKGDSKGGRGEDED